MDCQAVTGSGKPCSRRATRGHQLKAYCLQHYPAREVEKWSGELSKKDTILKMAQELVWHRMDGSDEEVLQLGKTTLREYGLAPWVGAGDVEYAQKVFKAAGYRTGTGDYALYVWRKRASAIEAAPRSEARSTA